MSVKDFTKGTANIPRPRGKKAWPTDSVDAVLQEGAAVLTPPAADKIGRGNLRQLTARHAENNVPEKEWVPARVAPGEAVIPPGAAEALGRDNIKRLNEQHSPDKVKNMKKKSIRGYANATEYVPFPNTGGQKPRRTKAAKAVTASNVADIEAFGKTIEKNALRDRVTGNISASQQGRTPGFSEFDQKAVEAPAKAEASKQAIQANDAEVRQHMADKKAKADAKIASSTAAAEKQKATIEQVKTESQARAEKVQNSLRQKTATTGFTGSAPNEAVVDATKAFTGSEGPQTPRPAPAVPAAPTATPDIPKSPGLFSKTSQNIARVTARAAAPLAIGKEIYDTSQNQPLLDDIAKFKNDPLGNLDTAGDLIHHYGKPLAEGLGGATGGLLGTVAGLGVASAPVGIAGAVGGAAGAGWGYDQVFGESKYRKDPAAAQPPVTPTATPPVAPAAPTVAPAAPTVAPAATPAPVGSVRDAKRALSGEDAPGSVALDPNRYQNPGGEPLRASIGKHGEMSFSGAGPGATEQLDANGRVSQDRYDAAQKVHQDRVARLDALDAKRAAFPGKGPYLAHIGKKNRGWQAKGTAAREEREADRAQQADLARQGIAAQVAAREQAQANADRAFNYQVGSDQAAAESAANKVGQERIDARDTIFNDDGTVNEQATASARAATDRFKGNTGASARDLAADPAAMDLQAFTRRAVDPSQQDVGMADLIGGGSMYTAGSNLGQWDSTFKKQTAGQPAVISPTGEIGGRTIDPSVLNASERNGLRMAASESARTFPGGPQAYFEQMKRANPALWGAINQ